MPTDGSALYKFEIGTGRTGVLSLQQASTSKHAMELGFAAQTAVTHPNV